VTSFTMQIPYPLSLGGLSGLSSEGYIFLQAMARLWRVGHFVLSDFLNLTLDQASSTHLSETPHLSSMAQVTPPPST